LEKLNQALARAISLADAKRVARFENEARNALQQLIPLLNQLPNQFDASAFEENVLRFEHGVLPSWLEEQAKELKLHSQKANQAVN
ncbi:hypothetical protein, partial [Bacillus cereus group sp. Bce006]